jgi:hypothetical protein
MRPGVLHAIVYLTPNRACRPHGHDPSAPAQKRTPALNCEICPSVPLALPGAMARTKPGLAHVAAPDPELFGVNRSYSEFKINRSVKNPNPVANCFTFSHLPSRCFAICIFQFSICNPLFSLCYVPICPLLSSPLHAYDRHRNITVHHCVSPYITVYHQNLIGGWLHSHIRKPLNPVRAFKSQIH